MQPAERRYDSPKVEAVKASQQQSLSGGRAQEQMEAGAELTEKPRKEESHQQKTRGDVARAEEQTALRV